MYECESWTIKKGEHQRIYAFELWCWRRLLRNPWIVRRSIQSILEEISPEYSLEGVMLNLKLQYFGHLMRRTDSFEKTLMLGNIEGGRWRGWQRMRWVAWHHWLDGHEFEWALGIGDGQESPVCCSPWGCKELDMLERLNRTELNWQKYVNMGASWSMAILNFPYSIRLRLAIQFCEMKKTMFIYTVYMLRDETIKKNKGIIQKS